MSYWITCQNCPFMENHTSNQHAMVKFVLGDHPDLDHWSDAVNGRSGGDVAELLAFAMDRLDNMTVEQMHTYDSPNGWGNGLSAALWMQKWFEHFLQNPMHVIHVGR